jgi:hypothetical protein
MIGAAREGAANGSDVQLTEFTRAQAHQLGGRCATTARRSRCLNRSRLRETRRAPVPLISSSARKPSYLSSKSQS